MSDELKNWFMMGWRWLAVASKTFMPRRVAVCGLNEEYKEPIQAKVRLDSGEN